VGLALALVPAVAACTRNDPALPAACRDGSAAVARALRAAPGDVTLRGGTRLSTCLQRADSDAELQEVGLSYTSVASDLAGQVPRSNAAAVQLGYLVGAAQKGADRTQGVGLELARRLAQEIGIGGPPAARKAAYQRGLAAGKRTG
jgi:hypothetical protein